VGERGAEPLEVRALEGAKAFEIDDSHGHIGSMIRGELKDLLGRARRNPGRSDNGERKDAFLGCTGTLEYGLGEQRHEAIGATLGSHLQLNGVGHSSSPQHEA
jgi:hypothetical protein